MLFPAVKLGDTVIGLDIHKGLIPAPPSPVPVPGPPLPYPYIGSLFLWLSPQWPSMNVFINGMPAATVGTKGYSVHIPPTPPHILTPPLQPLSYKWYLQNLLTVVIATNFQIIIGTVRGMIDPAIKGKKVPSVWQSYLSTIEGMHNWTTLFQSLLPPAVLPIAEGNTAIGSPTVTVNGAPMAMVGPMFACSCSEIPIMPNASVIGVTNVMVGVSFADLMMQFAWNAVSAASGLLAGKIVEKIKCRIGLEPIDLVSGCNFEDQTDFELPGPIPLRWVRAYRNLRDNDGPLGFGWTHEYHRYLAAREDGFDYVDGEGMHYALPFLPNVGDTHLHPTAFFQFSRLSESVYRIQTKDNILYSFEFPNLSPRALLISIADLNGNEIRFSYNKEKRLNGIRDSAYRSVAVECNAEGHIARLRLTGDSQEEANIILVSYEYDKQGNLSKVIDAAGNAYIYEYDDNHWMIKKTDRNGYSFHYEYNSIGQCIKSFGDDGLYSGEMQYYLPARTTLFKIPNGSTQIYKYNELNLVTGIIDAYGNVSASNYDRMGNLESEIDPNGNVRRLAYDERGNIVEEVDFQGRTTQSKWNELNLKIEETNAAGATCKWLYDEHGNLVEETDALGAVTQHRYNEHGWRIETRSPQDKELRFEYYPSGLLQRITDGSGSEVERFKYDILGNLVAAEVAHQTTHYIRDKLGQLIEVRFPDGKRVRQNFDAESNLTMWEDDRGRVWQYRYGSWNKLQQELDPLRRVTKYTCNKADELETVTDPGGTVTKFGYDLNDRISQIFENEKLLESYQHDAAGNLILKRNADGAVLLTVEVGPGGREEARQYGHGSAARFKYDQAGRLTEARTDDGTIERKYDTAGHINEEAWNGEAVAAEYDEKGRRVKLEWSEGIACKFQYRDPGNECTVTDPCGGVHKVLGIGYPTQTHILPNGLIETRIHDEHNRLTRLFIYRQNQADGSPLFSRTYDYDGVGNLIQKRDDVTGAREAYAYDLLDRITRVSPAQGGSQKIRYDDAGMVLPHPECEVGEGNRLRRCGELRLEYDHRGNVCKRTRGLESLQLHYDEGDRLVESKSTDGDRTSYGYDGLDKRAWKQTGNERTEFHWSGYRLLREVRGKSWRRIYVYFDPDADTPAMFVDLAREGEEDWQQTAYYIHRDGVGVPIAVSNEEGQIVWTMEMEPYGKATVHDPLSLGLNLRYPGQYYDVETGLYYNGYRMYDPETARFLQLDPLGIEGGLNMYAYSDNPLAETDPLGLKTKCEAKAAAASEEKEGKPTERGGKYGDLPLPENELIPITKKNGEEGLAWKYERHEIPPRSCVREAQPGLPREEIPAIVMEHADHEKTASWGRSDEAKEHRAAQEQLIKDGKFEEAFNNDVQNIRDLQESGAITPKDKYDKAITKAEDQMKSLKDRGLVGS